MQGGRSRAEERREKYPDDPLPLPEIDCPELAGFLFAAGPTQAGGMGEIPLTAQELRAWEDGCGLSLTPWEFQTVLMMSGAYTSEKYEAKDAARPEPMAPQLDGDKRQAIAKNIRNILRD